ncbi:MAG: M3 family oligoendopeptidase [Meiothermus sp.]|uniref:M3 family oligoendopeptidase n=1 Tax=Meiothermus sp. TaxID=1955249 RepID=UPI0025DC3E06|nr:M3 family oligoendopeptidase [Meiothermus sp.]MCS7058907.1 M3 family oligoendopeptidase [Meiothermus sp.]MCS7195078.1 M3 family oligoendopeptidase [Meiothermus sp.]MCX7740415.1 M3 family oligoendopeptidase [Meiothermus sp.]MDW8090128.1 M3 family oligoendopeptidase [Meiothermus sp.]MDW8481431.1 M3 family oligoendopeptidase [Meiothermus sp.]
MSATTSELPTWDLDSLFPGLESEAFLRTWQQVEAQLAELRGFMETHRIGKEGTAKDRGTFLELVDRLNAFGDTLGPLYAYLVMRVDSNSADSAARARLSELELVYLEFQKLRPRLQRWLAELDPEEVQAGEYRLLLEEARIQAAHMMSEPEETLAAELSLCGGRAWVKLHTHLTSQITARVNGEELPISAVRNLAMHPEESVRKAAYQAELQAWEAHRIPLSAALNGYKGEVSTLNRRRGWEDDLAPALFENRIQRKTLEALQSVMVASFPYWRRYFAAKARALGKPQLDWWDLFAPLQVPGGSPRRWSWEEGRSFILGHLAQFSPEAAALARQAFDERWLDAPPRKGKTGGAYCMPVGRGASRILLNHEDSYESVSTLAHELGHAYHNHCLREVPYLLRKGPMTLAETASIMNETVIGEAALKTLPPAEQLGVLEGSLQSAAQVIVDIHSRFLFERAVFAKRRNRELLPEEFCDLMLEAQRATYGEALATYHPYMWAVKGHYYGANFYNFPYAFGLLFGLALYQRYLSEGQSFLPHYKALLASVGKHRAEELAARFGFDLASEEFWWEGMRVLLRRIERFEALLGELWKAHV